ncbi:FAST kinase domain-containing protein 5, mitochondrial-like [Physella acuta]|uniref:FAST kinase domain-containing protein 5, mitochondrial-like n=1 Tax=Physella acuta TaxID=109671 RepID=UPI0027DE64EB|nr:FAST kinase domain-containing protein 5, mitochondrial-like [Physella acuta]
MSHAVFFNPAILRLIPKLSRICCANLPVVNFFSTWKPEVPNGKTSSLKSSQISYKHRDKQHNSETSRSQSDLYQTQVTQKYRPSDHNNNFNQGKRRFGNSDQYGDRFGHTKSFNAERAGVWVDEKQDDPAWLVKMHQHLMKNVTLPPSYNGYFDMSEENLEKQSIPQLMSLAKDLQTMDRNSKQIIVELWRRFDSMTVDQILTVADMFYIKQQKSANYYSAMLSYFNEMFELLDFTPHEMTRLVFHIKCHSNAPPFLYLAIEERLLQKFPDYGLNQIAIICHLLFVDRNRIKSVALLDQIASKFLQEFHILHPWYLPMMMKMFRYSNYIKPSFYTALGDKILATHYLKKTSGLSQVMHITFTYASVRVTHPALFSAILTHCESPVQFQRLKDISKIIWACGTLVTTEPAQLESVDKIVGLYRRHVPIDTILNYPDNLVDIVMGLIMLNIYPHDLIEDLFDPNIVKKALGLQNVREKFLQLHFIHNSVPIECPDYKGNRLSKSQLAIVEEKLKHLTLDVDVYYRKSVTPALESLLNALGDDKVHCKFVLPHFRTTDILLFYDRTKGCFIKPSEEQLASTAVPGYFDKNIERLVILLLSKANYTFDKKLLGMMRCKLRQLKTLGYKVIPIDTEEAEKYPLIDSKMREELLLGHISRALQVDDLMSGHSNHAC